MRVSIIINTYNRADHLRKLLSGLGHLKKVNFEVVVVNGPSTDETHELLEKYKSSIKIVDCPVRNLSVSRNMGIAAAAGDIVVFIDDDALPFDTDWLWNYVKAFSQDEGHHFGGMGGVVFDGDSESKQFIGGGTSDYGFQIFEIDPENPLAPDGTPWRQGVLGANCSFRRDALIKVGGFDEYFRYYLDETDVCYRLQKAGYSIRYLANNGVRHYSAASERRVSFYDRNWDVITKSDVFFALKNSKDPLLIRIYKVIALANNKFFVRDMIDFFYKNGEITRSHWLKLRFQWLRGFTQGFWDGLFKKRYLRSFVNNPPPFICFKTKQFKKPLRIALLTQSVPGQPSYGGIGRYTYDLARGLHERGHEVHIICRDERSVQHESLGFFIHGISDAQVINILDRNVKHPIVNKNISYAVAIEKKLASLYLLGIEFDIIHASNWDAEAAAIIREGIYPVVLMLVTPFAQVIQTEKWELSDDLKTCVSLDRWQIEQAEAICVPSEGVLKSYQALMDLHSKDMTNLFITPLGIIPHTQQVQVAKTHRRLLFVGRLEWRKGIHTLLSALPEIMPRFPDWECHLVGYDQMQKIHGETFKQDFQKHYQKAEWSNRVIFHGMVSEDELQRHYQNCDLFVAPSLFESFGLIFQEAMQYGKPVVGCLTGGIPEVVEHGVEGLLVPPNQPEALGLALTHLMQDDELRLRMGNAARERILQRDNYQTMAARLEKVYHQTILKKGAKYKARRKSIWD